MTQTSHLAWRSGNPALSTSRFEEMAGVGSDSSMTIAGVVNKTALLLFVSVVTAAYAWNASLESPAMGLLWLGLLGGLAVAVLTIFKKEWSPVTSPLYAALEGLVLGTVSAVFEQRFPGIVVQAVLLTFGTLAALLAAYRSGLIRVTENFRLGVVAATGGIFVVYMLQLVLRMFGSGIPFIHESGFIGIAFSLFVVAIAALNLVLDFDFIEAGAERGLPRFMEWYAAFGLLVTLIWLYLEILHLLAKIQGRR